MVPEQCTEGQEKSSGLSRAETLKQFEEQATVQMVGAVVRQMLAQKNRVVIVFDSPPVVQHIEQHVLRFFFFFCCILFALSLFSVFLSVAFSLYCSVCLFSSSILCSLFCVYRSSLFLFLPYRDAHDHTMIGFLMWLHTIA